MGKGDWLDGSSRHQYASSIYWPRSYLAKSISGRNTFLLTLITLVFIIFFSLSWFLINICCSFSWSLILAVQIWMIFLEGLHFLLGLAWLTCTGVFLCSYSAFWLSTLFHLLLYVKIIYWIFDCRWGGPLPQSWLDQQLVMQKKILDRMYELGMTPGTLSCWLYW